MHTCPYGVIGSHDRLKIYSQIRGPSSSLGAGTKKELEMIDNFSNEYQFLSNFYPETMEYKGEIYLSSEHAYQAAKATNKEDKKKVMDAPTCHLSKKIGRSIKVRKDWDNIKDQVMLKILRAKFSDPELRERLIETDGEELVEGNNWGDTYWGVCKGKGKNKLGKLLMQVRDEIIEEIPFTQGKTYDELEAIKQWYGIEKKLKHIEISNEIKKQIDLQEKLWNKYGEKLQEEKYFITDWNFQDIEDAKKDNLIAMSYSLEDVEYSLNSLSNLPSSKELDEYLKSLSNLINLYK